jgi:hypothetical protein
MRRDGPKGQKNENRSENNRWASRDIWAELRWAVKGKIEKVFKFLIQGNGIQIKSSEYFQTKFELDSK